MHLVKPILKTITPTDSRIVNTLHTRHEIFGNLVTDTKIHYDGYNRLISEIKNPFGKTLGHEIFSIDNDNKTMTGYFIETLPEYRKKGFRLGELLRLSSIITMLENKIKQLDIVSKDTAIYFHSKYKFQPSTTAFATRDNILKNIIQNSKNPLDEIIQNAIEFIEKLKQKPSAEEQRAITRETNKLAKTYIDRVMAQQSQKENMFDCAIHMKLTSENIIENKDFFNALFKQHGIDYEI
jgi:hypothetical protein